MKYFIIFYSYILLSLISISSYSQEDKSNYYFGFNLVQTMYGEMVHYGIARVFKDGEVEVTFISRRNFLLQITGQQFSKANPNKEDLFEKWGINFLIVNNLWMLRYSEYPYRSQDYDLGWAQLPMQPSESQLNLLKNYGFENIDSFIYGDNAFKLLKDMMSLEWVNNYRNIE